MTMKKWMKTASVLCLSLALLAGCSTAPTEATAEVTTQIVEEVELTQNNIETVNTLVTLWNEGDVEAIAGILKDGMPLHGPRPVGSAGFSGNYNGKTAFITHQTQMKDLLGDSSSVSIKQIIEKDNLVSVVYEYVGLHEGVYVNLKPSGQPLVVSVQDTYMIEGGKIVEVWHNPDRFSMLEKISAPKHEIPVHESIQNEIVASFKPGSFPESVVEHPNGDFFVTLQFSGQVWKVSGGEASLFIQMPEESLGGHMDGPSTLTVNDKGQVVVVMNSSSAEYAGIWAYDVVTGEGVKIVNLSENYGHLNGSAFDNQGNYYIAESNSGIVLQVPAGSNEARVWVDDPILGTRDYIGLAPGANGVQFFDGNLYVASPDRELLVKIPVNVDGTPGEMTVHAEGVGADDFAIDEDGTIYATTHIYNSIIEISPDGEIIGTIATVKEGVVGNTAAVISTDADGQKWLYITNDGGLLKPIGPELKPNLTRMPLN